MGAFTSSSSSSSSSSSHVHSLLSIERVLSARIHRLMIDTDGRISDPSSYVSHGIIDGVVELINFIIEKGIRRPELIVKFGKPMITSNSAKTKLEDQYWDIVEKVFYAAVQCYNTSISSECLSILSQRFGSSSQRIDRLIAFRSESMNNYSIAKKIYDKQLTTEPTLIWCMKRQVMMAITGGGGENNEENNSSSSSDDRSMDVEAMSQLSSYLKNYSNDENAWYFLGQLYLSNSMYEPARFCIEECILLSPENYLYYTILAEILYTLKAYDLSRAYYSQSLELKYDNNLRAVYGLLLSIKAGGIGSTGDKLYSWAIAKLINTYDQNKGQNNDIIKQIALLTMGVGVGGGGGETGKNIN